MSARNLTTPSWAFAVHLVCGWYAERFSIDVPNFGDFGTAAEAGVARVVNATDSVTVDAANTTVRGAWRSKDNKDIGNPERYRQRTVLLSFGAPLVRLEWADG